MDTLGLFNFVAIICEVVGLLGMVIGVPLSKYSKDYSFPLCGMYCLAAGCLVHLALHFGLLNFLA